MHAACQNFVTFAGLPVFGRIVLVLLLSYESERNEAQSN
jgi:hypothetical protein